MPSPHTEAATLITQLVDMLIKHSTNINPALVTNLPLSLIPQTTIQLYHRLENKELINPLLVHLLSNFQPAQLSIADLVLGIPMEYLLDHVLPFVSPDTVNAARRLEFAEFMATLVSELPFDRVQVNNPRSNDPPMDPSTNCSLDSCNQVESCASSLPNPNLDDSLVSNGHVNQEPVASTLDSLHESISHVDHTEQEPGSFHTNQQVHHDNSVVCVHESLPPNPSTDPGLCSSISLNVNHESTAQFYHALGILTVSSSPSSSLHESLPPNYPVNPENHDCFVSNVEVCNTIKPSSSISEYQSLSLNDQPGSEFTFSMASKVDPKLSATPALDSIPNSLPPTHQFHSTLSPSFNSNHDYCNDPVNKGTSKFWVFPPPPPITANEFVEDQDLSLMDIDTDIFPPVAQPQNPLPATSSCGSHTETPPTPKSDFVDDTSLSDMSMSSTENTHPPPMNNLMLVQPTKPASTDHICRLLPMLVSATTNFNTIAPNDPPIPPWRTSNFVVNGNLYSSDSSDDTYRPLDNGFEAAGDEMMGSEPGEIVDVVKRSSNNSPSIPYNSPHAVVLVSDDSDSDDPSGLDHPDHSSGKLNDQHYTAEQPDLVNLPNHPRAPAALEKARHDLIQAENLERQSVHTLKLKRKQFKLASLEVQKIELELNQLQHMHTQKQLALERAKSDLIEANHVHDSIRELLVPKRASVAKLEALYGSSIRSCQHLPHGVAHGAQSLSRRPDSVLASQLPPQVHASIIAPQQHVPQIVLCAQDSATSIRPTTKAPASGVPPCRSPPPQASAHQGRPRQISCGADSSSSMGPAAVPGKAGARCPKLKKKQTLSTKQAVLDVMKRYPSSSNHAIPYIPVDLPLSSTCPTITECIQVDGQQWICVDQLSCLTSLARARPDWICGGVGFAEELALNMDARVWHEAQVASHCASMGRYKRKRTTSAYSDADQAGAYGIQFNPMVAKSLFGVADFNEPKVYYTRSSRVTEPSRNHELHAHDGYDNENGLYEIDAETSAPSSWLPARVRQSLNESSNPQQLIALLKTTLNLRYQAQDELVRAVLADLRRVPSSLKLADMGPNIRPKFVPYASQTLSMPVRLKGLLDKITMRHTGGRRIWTSNRSVSDLNESILPTHPEEITEYEWMELAISRLPKIVTSATMNDCSNSEYRNSLSLLTNALDYYPNSPCLWELYMELFIRKATLTSQVTHMLKCAQQKVPGAWYLHMQRAADVLKRSDKDAYVSLLLHTVVHSLTSSEPRPPQSFVLDTVMQAVVALDNPTAFLMGLLTAANAADLEDRILNPTPTDGTFVHVNLNNHIPAGTLDATPLFKWVLPTDLALLWLLLIHTILVDRIPTPTLAWFMSPFLVPQATHVVARRNYLFVFRPAGFTGMYAPHAKHVECALVIMYNLVHAWTRTDWGEHLPCAQAVYRALVLNYDALTKLSGRDESGVLIDIDKSWGLMPGPWVWNRHLFRAVQAGDRNGALAALINAAVCVDETAHQITGQDVTVERVQAAIQVYRYRLDIQDPSPHVNIRKLKCIRHWDWIHYLQLHAMSSNATVFPHAQPESVIRLLSMAAATVACDPMWTELVLWAVLGMSDGKVRTAPNSDLIAHLIASVAEHPDLQFDLKYLRHEDVAHPFAATVPVYDATQLRRIVCTVLPCVPVELRVLCIRKLCRGARPSPDIFLAAAVQLIEFNGNAGLITSLVSQAIKTGGHLESVWEQILMLPWDPESVAELQSYAAEFRLPIMACHSS